MEESFKKELNDQVWNYTRLYDACQSIWQEISNILWIGKESLFFLFFYNFVSAP